MLCNATGKPTLVIPEEQLFLNHKSFITMSLHLQTITPHVKDCKSL